MIKFKSGFTIVELLVVIVVIGILAAITIVSYTGISQKAKEVSLQSDLDNASKQIKLFQVAEPSGNYPTANVCPNPGATEICLKASGSNSYSYLALNEDNPKRFTLDATSGTTTYRITNDSAPVAVNELFSDGFETGDLAGWSSSVTDGGDLSASIGAKLHGNYGLNVLIDDTTGIFVIDNTPNAEIRYRSRFYMDPNGLTMANNDGFSILMPLNESYLDAPFNVYLIRTNSSYKIAIADEDWSVYVETIISDAPHYIEIDWKAGTGDGFLHAWIDGTQVIDSNNVTNNTYSVGTVLFGAHSTIDAGTSGTIYLDDFSSNIDGSEIGSI